MSKTPTIKKTIGVKGIDGIDYIISIPFACDMGDHGRIHYPLKLGFGLRNGTELVFKWASKKTENVIYEEIEKK